MNDELLNQDISDYLSHSGVPGMSWYKHKFGKWQKQAQYAGGMDDPNAHHTSVKKELKKAIAGVNHNVNKNTAYKTYFKLAFSAFTGNQKGIDEHYVRIMKAMAAKQAEKTFDQRVVKLKVDQNTGLHLKRKPMSEDEDMSAVNPGYNDFNTNTKQNCMLCTTAYELRRRGYDVRANKAGFGYKEEDIKKWFPNAKILTFNPTKNDVFKLNDKEYNNQYNKALKGENKELANKVVSDLLKQGDGARGNLIMQFGWAGHSVAYEVKDGRVFLRDCQRSSFYKDPTDLLRYSIQASYARTDNLDFDPNTIKEAVR